jgi:hypothetical protein
MLFDCFHKEIFKALGILMIYVIRILAICRMRADTSFIRKLNKSLGISIPGLFSS